jgi:succinate dehydrogenase / fumarate reductase, cytochrome b subunit
MNRLHRFYRTATGKKIVMGVTGLIGIGFVILHMAGNLLAFRGPDAINAYAYFLASTGELLWLLRITLIAAVILHVVAAYQLTMQNRAARPVGYVRREPQVSRAVHCCSYSSCSTSCTSRIPGGVLTECS